jgi:AcrR family transcriptional regulator
MILDVAGQVFARGGYHAGSMDEIADRAGVSKPMLYAYFGSKEGLYVAYIGRTGRELVERLEGAGDPEDAALPRLRARIGEFLAFVEEHRDGWIVLFRETNASRPLAEEVAELRSRIIDAVCRMLQSSTPEHLTLPPTACEGLAHAIVGAGESLANWWLEDPDVRREEVADWYVALVQGAVAAGLRHSAR